MGKDPWGLALALLCWPALGVAQLDFERADRETVRLHPTHFVGVPKTVKATLNGLGCLIPQSGTNKPHNVIRGEFMKAGRTQWAALCSRNRSSAIIVLDENGRIRAELASAPDRNFLQDIGGGKIGYSRGLSSVGADLILDHYHAYGGSTPPPIDHQGINDAFLEKASIVHYFHEGKWLELTGAD